MSEHRWKFCRMCGPMVVCGKCGNNSCNGGVGRADGKGPWNGDPEVAACQECSESWEWQRQTRPPIWIALRGTIHAWRDRLTPTWRKIERLW